MNWFETAFGAHYPLLYAHRDAAEARRAVAALAALAPLGPGPVLDLGCGAGRHLGPLAAHGSAVLGLDLSAPLLARAARAARRTGGDLWLVRADMRRLPVRDAAVTAVLSLFTAFGYFGDLRANAPVVSEVSRVLRPGGRWFLDYLNCDMVVQEIESDSTAVTRRLAGPLIVREQRRLDGGRVVKRVDLAPAPGRVAEAALVGVSREGLRYEEQVALFAPAELDALCAQAGLRRVAAGGGYEGQAPGPGAPRWLFVYQRAGSGEDGT